MATFGEEDGIAAPTQAHADNIKRILSKIELSKAMKTLDTGKNNPFFVVADCLANQGPAKCALERKLLATTIFRKLKTYAAEWKTAPPTKLATIMRLFDRWVQNKSKSPKIELIVVDLRRSDGLITNAFEARKVADGVKKSLIVIRHVIDEEGYSEAYWEAYAKVLDEADVSLSGEPEELTAWLYDYDLRLWPDDRALPSDHKDCKGDRSTCSRLAAGERARKPLDSLLAVHCQLFTALTLNPEAHPVFSDLDKLALCNFSEGLRLWLEADHHNIAHGVGELLPLPAVLSLVTNRSYQANGVIVGDVQKPLFFFTTAIRPSSRFLQHTPTESLDACSMSTTLKTLFGESSRSEEAEFLPLFILAPVVDGSKLSYSISITTEDMKDIDEKGARVCCLLLLDRLVLCVTQDLEAIPGLVAKSNEGESVTEISWSFEADSEWLRGWEASLSTVPLDSTGAEKFSRYLREFLEGIQRQSERAMRLVKLGEFARPS